MKQSKKISGRWILILLALTGIVLAGCPNPVVPPAIPTHTISFDKNDVGAAGTMPPQTIASGSSANLTANAYTLTGYAFAGWMTTAGGSVAYADQAAYTMGTADVTLYAKWTTLSTYTVTYNGNGNTSGNVPTDSTNYLSGHTVTVLGNTGNLVKTGNAFAGWNTAADGSGTPYTASQTFTLGSSNATLYAIWTANTYTVTFDPNGGSGSMTPQSLAFGATAHLSANAFTRTSFVFAGWAMSPTGGVAYSDKQSLIMGPSNMTVYAVWTASNSLLVHYSFSNQDCADSSGNGNNGTANSITYVSDGNGGYSASFNGSSSYITLPYDLVRSQTAFTIMMRFKAGPGMYGSLFGYQNTTVGSLPTQFIPMITIRSDGLLYGELWTGSTLSVLSSTVVNDGNWHTVYFSATASSITLYLDGVAIATNTGTVNPLSMSYNQIGTSDAALRPYQPNATASSNYWYYFNGLIGDFYLYNAAVQ